MSGVGTRYQFELDLKKVDQHTGGKCLIHGTKHHKDKQLQTVFAEPESLISYAMIYHQAAYSPWKFSHFSW